ncbi:hypothetical protein CFP56_005610, partial [Quercus suber]
IHFLTLGTIKIRNPKSILHLPNFQIPIYFRSNLEQESSMSATSKASWMVAASIGAVEALKDQGVCRWNYPLRSLQQHAKNNIRSYYQAKKLSAQSSSAICSKVNNEKLKQSETKKKKKPLEKLTRLSIHFLTLGTIKIRNPKSILHLPNFQIPIYFRSNLEQESSMSATSKASWMVAASIGAVEALKDQGVCRWNYPLRSLQQHAKNNIRSYYQAKKLSAQSSSAICSKVNNEKLKQSEESLRNVMYLSCWGYFSQTAGKTTYSFAPKIFSPATIFTHYIRFLPLH